MTFPQIKTQGTALIEYGTKNVALNEDGNTSVGERHVNMKAIETSARSIPFSSARSYHKATPQMAMT
jgi:hypothetical protein